MRTLMLTHPNFLSPQYHWYRISEHWPSLVLYQGRYIPIKTRGWAWSSWLANTRPWNGIDATCGPEFSTISSSNHYWRLSCLLYLTPTSIGVCWIGRIGLSFPRGFCSCPRILKKSRRFFSFTLNILIVAETNFFSGKSPKRRRRHLYLENSW